MNDHVRDSPAPVHENIELRIVDAAGHPLREGALADGSPVWVHLGLSITNCPAVLSLLELCGLPAGDDFRLPWTERGWRQLPFEGETGEV